MKPRLHYFDMLKGIAIFMVVMGHVIAMCVREIDRAPLFKFIGAVHMPLFFFISGWMSYRSDGRGVGIVKRAAQLIVPMVFMSTLWLWYFPHSGLQSPLNSTFDGLWHDSWKNGYWFTLVLFEIIAVYAAIKPLLSRAKSIVTEIGIFAITWGILFLIWFCVKDSTVIGILSLDLMVGFFPIFCIGAIAHKYKDCFERATQSSPVFTAAIVACGVTLYLESWPWEFAWLEEWMRFFIRIILHISLAIIGIAVVKPWSINAFGEDAPQDGRPVARMWTYIGKESLAIYLLHYFFLFPLWVTRDALTACGLAFVPLLVFSAFVAAAIVAVVLCVNRLLQPSSLLSWLMCGRLPEFIKKIK
ncbi:MAG: acyltransferase [Muribaculaceae bacterium]|nr:acyltransferase [Muribaculaceae bacterium]